LPCVAQLGAGEVVTAVMNDPDVADDCLAAYCDGDDVVEG